VLTERGLTQFGASVLQLKLGLRSLERVICIEAYHEYRKSIGEIQC